ncbi:MAG: ATP-dependent Clp protease adaptor ClpS [Elusimicrobia bacterium]|jgi:ATP-dependent Clp protease adaptor protein ClpS|nr:ATP-dependent Clp protease adaptor ClpS [Elusimicrobiota bacterium]
MILKSAGQTIESPSSETTEGSRSFTGWKTILFNCDCHSFPEVAIQLVRAIRCDYQRGLALANVIHYTGSATVYTGPRERCEAVAETLGTIGLRVSVCS